jgi:hypothetical protein
MGIFKSDDVIDFFPHPHIVGKSDQCLSCILYNWLALFQCLTVVCMPKNETEWFDRVFLDHGDSMMAMVMIWQSAKSSMFKTVSVQHRGIQVIGNVGNSVTQKCCIVCGTLFFQSLHA